MPKIGDESEFDYERRKKQIEARGGFIDDDVMPAINKAATADRRPEARPRRVERAAREPACHIPSDKRRAGRSQIEMFFGAQRCIASRGLLAVGGDSRCSDHAVECRFRFRRARANR